MSKYQVKYEDSNNNTVVLAQHRTNNTDPDLDADAIAQADRILPIRQAQGQDKAKIWCDPSIIGNLPVRKSEYATAENGQKEREIFIEEWNGSSWDKIFRGKPKAKPSTDDNGQALFILQGFGQQTGKEDVNYQSGGTTSIDVILENVLPPGYTVSAAPAADWPTGSIPVREDYSIVNEQRQIAYRELTKTPDASIQFTTELSGGDYVVRLEPRGHGGVVDTVQGPRDKDSNGTLGLFREWEGENPETVINKIRITGTNRDGEAITQNGDYPVATDQTSIDDYGVKYKSKNVPYVNSFSEGETLANELLRPEPVPGGGVVKTPRYTDSVVNSSFELVDSRNNVNAVYTAVKVRNYLHEQATEIIFEYETASEADAENQVQTVYERNKVYPESTTENSIGPLDINESLTDTEVVSEQYDADSQDNHPHGNSNSTSNAGFITATPAVDELLDQRTISTNNSETWTFSNLNADVASDPVFIGLNLDASSSTADLAVRVDITFDFGGFNTYYQETVTTGNGGDFINTVAVNESFEGLTIDEVELTILNVSSTSQTIDGIIEILAQQDHDHFVPIADTDGNTADLSIDVNSNDASAGDTSQLTVSGETVDELVDILQTIEEKTDR